MRVEVRLTATAVRATSARGWKCHGPRKPGQGIPVEQISLVLLAPGVHCGLSILDAGERAGHVQQFLLQRLVQCDLTSA
jgi:hypothetical protein